MLVGLSAIIVLPYLPTKTLLSSYAIVSGSMEPTVHLGSIAFIRKVPEKELHTGDVIAFTDPKASDKNILHRIYKILNNNGNLRYITQGDNNPLPDNWDFAYILIKGKYLFSLPYLGNITIQLRNPLGFGIIIGIPALILMWLNFLKVKEGLKEEIEKKAAIAVQGSIPNNDKISILLVPFLIISIAIAHIPIGHAEMTKNVTIKDFAASTAAHIDLEKSKDDHELTFHIRGFHRCKHLSYTLTYKTDSITEDITGDESLQDKNEFGKTITLGTCSTNTCASPKHIKNVHLKFTLEHDSGQKEILEKSLD